MTLHSFNKIIIAAAKENDLRLIEGNATNDNET